MVILSTVALAQEFKNWQSLHSSFLGRPFFCQILGIHGVSTSFTTIFNGVLFLSCFFHFLMLAFILRSFSATENCIIGHWGVEGNRNTQGLSQEARIYRLSFFGRCATIPLAVLWFRICVFSSLFCAFAVLSGIFQSLSIFCETENPQKIILFQELLTTLVVFDQLELLAQNLPAFRCTYRPV